MTRTSVTVRKKNRIDRLTHKGKVSAQWKGVALKQELDQNNVIRIFIKKNGMEFVLEWIVAHCITNDGQNNKHKISTIIHTHLPQQNLLNAMWIGPFTPHERDFCPQNLSII